MSKKDDLLLAQQLSKQSDLDGSYRIADKYLRENPNDVDWLMVMVYIMLESGKPTIAYNLAKRCVELEPQNPSMYLNFGMAANDLWRGVEAERMYRRGMKLSQRTDQLCKFLINLSGVYIDNGRFEEAKGLCEKVLEMNPESRKGRANLGFCQVALQEWDVGWPNYRLCLGTEWRPKTQYGNEPEWDGVSRGTIVLYAEQGIGDMICFASMLPDMIAWCDENDSTVVLDCDWRLYTLFKRSFPDLAMYPTAGVTAETMQPQWKWKDEHCQIDYSLPMGQLAEYFRTSKESFPKEPFLTPDADEEFKWRALFDAKKKPVIGVAWSGGMPKTGAHLKTLDLEQLLPLFEAIDAHWVCLQYKPAGAEIEEFKENHPDIDIVEYKNATLNKDYDITASLVASLDAVVSVPTSIVHLAGSLGVRTIAMEARMRCWKFESGNPFHPITAQIPHSDDWNATIRETASHLEDLCLLSVIKSDSGQGLTSKDKMNAGNGSSERQTDTAASV